LTRLPPELCFKVFGGQRPVATFTQPRVTSGLSYFCRPVSRVLCEKPALSEVGRVSQPFTHSFSANLLDLFRIESETASPK
jgi:hypothetical protein